MSRLQMNIERRALAALLSFAYGFGPAGFAASTTDDGSGGATRDPRAMPSAGQSGVDRSELGQRAPASGPADPARVVPSFSVGPDGVMPNGLLPNPPTYG